MHHISNPIYFQVPIDLAALRERRFRQILIDETLLLALLETVRVRIPSFLTIRLDHILAGVAAMRIVLLGSIAAAAFYLFESSLRRISILREMTIHFSRNFYLHCYPS